MAETRNFPPQPRRRPRPHPDTPGRVGTLVDLSRNRRVRAGVNRYSETTPIDPSQTQRRLEQMPRARRDDRRRRHATPAEGNRAGQRAYRAKAGGQTMSATRVYGWTVGSTGQGPQLRSWSQR